MHASPLPTPVGPILGPLLAQHDPFSGRPVQPSPTAVPLEAFREAMQVLHQWMVQSLSAEAPAAAYLPPLLAATILYGVLHALLPGHQKGLVAGYLLGRDTRKGEAVVLGALVGLAHLSSSVLAYSGMLLLKFLAEGALSLFEAQRTVSQVFSAVAASGTLLLSVALMRGSLGALREVRRRHDLEEVARLMDVSLPERDAPRPPPRGRMLSMVFVASLVPCPGTLLVLLFAFSLQNHLAGLLAAAGISLGAGLTVGLIAGLTHWARERGLRLAARLGVERFALVVQLTAAGLLFLSATVLLASGGV